jgi:hypothetical protein
VVTAPAFITRLEYAGGFILSRRCCLVERLELGDEAVMSVLAASDAGPLHVFSTSSSICSNFRYVANNTSSTCCIHGDRMSRISHCTSFHIPLPRMSSSMIAQNNILFAPSRLLLCGSDISNDWQPSYHAMQVISEGHNTPSRLPET